MLDKDGRMAASEYVAYRHDQRAAIANAHSQKLKLFPYETRPFNYARLSKDEAPQLHALISREHQGDNGYDGNERACEKDEGSSEGNEIYLPSSDDGLDDDHDQMLGEGSSSAPLRIVDNNCAEDENDLVDYNPDEEGDVFSNGDGDNTVSAKTLGDNHADEVKTFEDIRVEGNDKLGDECPQMDIISRQPHALMQKMGWEQKKQCCAIQRR